MAKYLQHELSEATLKNIVNDVYNDVVVDLENLKDKNKDSEFILDEKNIE